jgi:hypothetical protein
MTRPVGTDGVLPPNRNISLHSVLPNLMVFPLYCAFPFQIGFIWVSLKGKAIRRRLLYVITVFGIALQLVTRSLPQTILLCLIIVGGIAVLELAQSAVRSRNWVYLTCAIWLLVPLAALPYFQFPPKYLIASAPGAAILISYLLCSSPRAFQYKILLTATGLSLAASVLILRADVRYAEMARQAALELIAPRVQKGEQVWFTGEWGIYWYAQRAGARVYVPGVSKPDAGDLLVVGQRESRNGVLESFPSRSLVQEKIFSWNGGRVMSEKDMAGLYTTGRLAWTWGSGEVNRYQVWRLE